MISKLKIDDVIKDWGQKGNNLLQGAEEKRLVATRCYRSMRSWKKFTKSWLRFIIQFLCMTVEFLKLLIPWILISFVCFYHSWLEFLFLGLFWWASEPWAEHIAGWQFQSFDCHSFFAFNSKIRASFHDDSYRNTIHLGKQCLILLYIIFTSFFCEMFQNIVMQ